MSTRLLALTIVTIFVGSVLAGFTADMNPLEVEKTLEEEPVVYSAATSPGHVVFAQYISSDNCPHCYKAGGGSASHHQLKPISLTNMCTSHTCHNPTVKPTALVLETSLLTNGSGPVVVHLMPTSATEPTGEFLDLVQTTTPTTMNSPVVAVCTPPLTITVCRRLYPQMAAHLTSTSRTSTQVLEPQHPT